MRDIPSGFELLHPFSLLGACRAVQIFVLEFRRDGLANLGDEFSDGGDTARRCMSLQWPGVSALLSVLIKLLTAF